VSFVPSSCYPLQVSFASSKIQGRKGRPKRSQEPELSTGRSKRKPIKSKELLQRVFLASNNRYSIPRTVSQHKPVPGFSQHSQPRRHQQPTKRAQNFGIREIMIDQQTKIGMIIGFAFLGVVLLFLLLCYCTTHAHEMARRAPRPRPAQGAAPPRGQAQAQGAAPAGQGQPAPNIPDWGYGRGR
jgi:hypothetical protein